MSVAQRSLQSVPWHRENPVADFIPYHVQIDDHTIKTRGGDYLQVIKLAGIAHESADCDDVTIWKEQLNGLLRNIASPQVCLWTTTVRRESTLFPAGQFDQPFDRELNDRYRAHVTRDKMMVNDLYLSIIYRPTANKVLRLFSRVESSRAVLRRQQLEAIDKLNDIVATALSALSRYGARLLSSRPKVF
jgi:type IV secretion system protein VirB4